MTSDLRPDRRVPHISVRLRPLTQNEIEADEQEAWLAGQQLLKVKGPAPKPGQQQEDVSWAFDAVFGPEDSSDQVYANTCAMLVAESMQGFNSLALCYGPTGAGKTYTMGALMRMAAKDIFAHIRKSSSSYLLRFSACELYNEVVTDMLAASKDGEAPALRVLEDPERGGPRVEGLSEVVVMGEEHVEELFKRVEACRHVRETRQNTASSRSHQIVRIVVESRPNTHAPSAPAFVSTMHFVDLCGSERLSQVPGSNPDDEKLRQKETSNINRSLLTLGTVIRALGDPAGRKHVPYRDSKLTRILQPALSGNAAMCIITTLSPAQSSVENAKAALHFATAAKKIVLAPQLNTVTDDSQSVIKRMQAEIDFLRQQMRAAEAAEVEGWKTKIEEKDEHLRKATEEKAALEKKLRNMERLILSGQSWGQGTAGEHYSDASINLAALDLPLGTRSAAHEGAGCASVGGADAPLCSARRRHPAAAAVRASWDPRSAQSMGGDGAGGLPPRLPTSRPSVQMPQLSFLDFFKSHARKAGSSPAPENVRQPAVPKLDLTKVAIAKLEAPKGQQADEALAALKAEVRCIAATVGTVPTTAKQGLEVAIEHLAAGIKALESEVAAMENDQTPENVAKAQATKTDLEAMRRNLQRLQDRQQYETRAASALAALSEKLHPHVAEEEEGGDPCFNAIPAWMQEMFDNELDAAAVGSPTEATSAVAMGAPLTSRQPMSNGQRPPRTVNRYNTEDDQAESDSGIQTTPVSKGPKRSSLAGAGDIRQPDQVGDQIQAQQVQAGTRPAVSEAQSEGPTASGLTDLHTPGSSGYDASSTGRQGAGGSGSKGGSGMKRWNTMRVQAALKKQKEAVAQWYRSELARVQAELKASASADLEAVREALEQYKEMADRLETQKALLLHQVLKLELALEEEGEAKTALQHQIHKLMCERDQARFEAVQSKAAARAAAAAAASVQAMAAQAAAEKEVEESTSERSPHVERRLSFFDEAEEEWGKETPESLMTAILTLWHELHIPLSYRSRFYLGFKGKELFYFELEHRRLEWQRSQQLAAGNHRERDKAARALEWERKSLAQSLKYAVDDESRDELFREWGVSVHAKERKLQLVHKLWHPRTLEQPDGAARSAELVVALTGTDATEQFMQLIFGGTKALQPKPINVLVQNLVKRVSNGPASTPRGRQRSPGPVPMPGSSDVSGLPGGSNASTMGRPPLTPRRSSLGNMLAGLGLGSKRPPGVPSLGPLPPHGGGILAQLGLTPRGTRPANR